MSVLASVPTTCSPLHGVPVVHTHTSFDDQQFQLLTVSHNHMRYSHTLKDEP